MNYFVLSTFSKYGMLRFLSLVICFNLATFLRLRWSYGQQLGAEYVSFPLGILFILFASALITIYVFENPFIKYLTSILLSALISLLFLPDLSVLQLIYFGVISVLWGWVYHAYIPSLLKKLKQPILNELLELWRFRFLFRLWLIYRLKLRYSQTLLGILWIILLPFLNVIVLAFALETVLKVKTIDNLPFVPFMFCGQIVYTFFSGVILKSRESVLQQLSLSNTIYFPKYFGLLLNLGEALVDFSFVFITCIFLNMLSGIPITFTYFYLIFPLSILFLLTIGLSFIVGYLGVLLRDLQQLIGIILQLLFFLLPIFYSSSSVKPPFDALMWFNPLAKIIENTRNIMLLGVFDVSLLLLPTLIAITVFFVGFLIFLVNQDSLIEYL
jgi:lipopolysaccharide transport system permease protein